MATDKNLEMLTLHPTLPMRDRAATVAFFVDKLGFHLFGNTAYEGCLLLEKDCIQVPFFEFKTLDPEDNYRQVYLCTNDIDRLYQSYSDQKVSIHPDGKLQLKSWGSEGIFYIGSG